MNEIEEIIAQIKVLALSITEENYHVEMRKGYKYLTRLHDLGAEKESVYQVLEEYHSSLEDSLSRDYIADILDCIVGWCSPQHWIWNR